MLSPDHHTRMALVADRQAELRRRARVRLTPTTPSELRPLESRRLPLRGRLALVRRAAYAA